MTDYQEHLLLKFLHGTISLEELDVLNAWINASAENRKVIEDFTAVWRASKDQVESLSFNTADEWKKFEASISKKELTEQKAVNFNAYVYGLKIAASIAVIAVFSTVLYLAMFSRETILNESHEAVIELALPDGSKVWLNHHSRLAYQDNFNTKQRVVKLSGEAFFEVKKNTQMPFIIQTTRAQIKVLGTSFNVRAYEEANAMEVFVETGQVSFASIKNKKHVITLSPGETGTLTKNNNLVMLKTDENFNAMAWKEKRLIFKKTSLDAVVESLEEYFKIDIDIINKNILRCRFTGSFNQPTLEEIIEALSVSLDLTISKETDTYVVDGAGC